MLHELLTSIKVLKVGWLTLALNHSISQPNSKISTQIAQSSQRGVWGVLESVLLKNGRVGAAATPPNEGEGV